MRQASEFFADQRKSLWPFDWHIMVRGRVVCHRMGNPTLFLEQIIRPPSKLAYRMLCKEFRRHALGRRLPCQSLCPVLAKYQRVGMPRGRVRPRATRAFKPARFVHVIEGCRSLEQNLLFPKDGGSCFCRSPSPAGFMIWLDSWLTAHCPVVLVVAPKRYEYYGSTLG